MNRLQKQLYATGLFLFLIPSIVFVLATLLWFICVPVNGWLFLVSIGLAAGISYQAFSPRSLKEWSWLFLGGLIIVGSLLIAVQFYDCSFDGQWYHQDAIIFLSDGWNPVWDAAISNNAVSGLNANYVNHYPKAPWVIEATLYLFTGNIEAGKAIQLIYLVSFMFLLLTFLKNRFMLSWGTAILITLLVGGSTVSLGQLFSFYVDGLLFSLLGILLLFLLELIYYDAKVLGYMGLAFVVLANIKFTGLIYGMVFLMMAGIWVILRHKDLIIKRALHFSSVVLIGVVFIGYPTYVRNVISKGHPLFPIMGQNNEGKSIAEVQYPADFFPMNRFEKLIAAHASLPIYTDHEHASVKKPLFNKNLILESIPYYKNHQPVTMSPFGPFEGELLVVFIPLLCLFFLRRRPLALYLLFGGILLSMVIQPEAWNLRYAPQLLLIFAIVLTVLMQEKTGWIRVYSMGFAGLFILNSSIAVFQNWRWVTENNAALIQELEPMRKTHVKIQAGWMKSFELKLKHFEITPVYELDSNGVYNTFPGDAFSGWKVKKDLK
jgi:hypothetical protein